MLRRDPNDFDERGNDRKLAKMMKQIEVKLNNAGSIKASVVKA